jgi:hypothetical protein
MTEAAINTLMSAVEEVSWEQVKIFNETDKPLLSKHLPTLEPLPVVSTKPSVPFSFSCEDRAKLLRSVNESPVHFSPGVDVTNDVLKCPGGGEANSVGLKTLTKRHTIKKPWLPN